MRVVEDVRSLPLFDRSKWKRVRFGDVVKQMKEQVDPEADGIERYVAGEHMETENVHIRKWGTVGDGYLGPAFIRGFRKGQVLYGSRRTYLKKVAVAEWDGVTANTTFVLETVKEKMLQELLPWLMLSESFTKHSVQESKGSTNPYINFPDIAKFEFDLPPLDQQRRIAEILWAVDEAIGNYGQTETATEQAANALRDEHFTDSRQSKTLVPVRSVGRWVSGNTPSRGRTDYWSGDFPWVSPKDMKVPLIADAEEHLSDAGRSEATIVGRGSLLIVIRGMILAHSFPLGITQRDVAFNQDMKALIPNDTHSVEYVFHWFRWATSKILSCISDSSHGTKRLAMEDLFAMKIPTPSSKEQTSFVERLKSHEAAGILVKRNVQHLGNLRSALLNQVFSAS
jgi:type I restriction enzyme S subunit